MVAVKSQWSGTQMIDKGIQSLVKKIVGTVQTPEPKAPTVMR